MTELRNKHNLQIDKVSHDKEKSTRELPSLPHAMGGGQVNRFWLVYVPTPRINSGVILGSIRHFTPIDFVSNDSATHDVNRGCESTQ